VLHTVDLTLDCADAERVAAFWRTAAGYVDEPPPAPYESRKEWLASLGEDVGERVGAASLTDPRGVAPRLALIEVPELKIAKNRLHLDLRVSDAATPDERWRQILTEATRLVAAGARVLAEHEGHPVVLADPEGNEFCVA
jgi:hypothetical protein